MTALDGEWVERSPMPATRHDMSCFAHGGRAYAVSGANERTAPETLVYDPGRDEWRTDGPRIPTPRGWYGGAAGGDRAYVAGGKTVRSGYRSGGPPPEFTAHAAVERLDLSSGEWSALPDLSTPRVGLAAAVLDGRPVVVGGERPPDGAGEEAAPYVPHERPWRATDRVEVLDDDGWSATAPLPAPRVAPAAETVDDHLFVLGGFLDGEFHDDVHRLDPGEGWERRAPMSVGRRDFASCVHDGRAYVLGGLTNGSRQTDDGEVYERYTAVCERYDPAADEWERLPPLPEAKAWAEAAVVDDRLFVFGGANRGGRTDLDVANDFEFETAVHEFVPA